MSVLVKGMKMPKGCNDCEIHVYAAKDEDVWCGKEIRIIKRHCTEYKYYHQDIPRPDWCPLVEVKTPHGRLIDENEIIIPSLSSWADQAIVADAIKDAPTVIDAGVEE